MFNIITYIMIHDNLFLYSETKCKGINIDFDLIKCINVDLVAREFVQNALI